MEIAQLFRLLRTRKRWVALVIVAAVGAAVAMKTRSGSAPTGSATAQVLVDSPQSALADLRQDTAPLAERASVFAQLMTSGQVLDEIAKFAGVPASQVTAEGPYSGTGEVLDVPTPSEARGSQIVGMPALYHLSFVAQQQLPVITVSVEGPTVGSAARVANAVTPAMAAWLASVDTSSDIQSNQRVTVRQLGNAQAGAINSSSGTILAGVTFIGVLGMGLLAIIFVGGAFARRRTTRATSEAEATGHEPASYPRREPAPARDLIMLRGGELARAPAGTDYSGASQANYVADSSAGYSPAPRDDYAAAHRRDHSSTPPADLVPAPSGAFAAALTRGRGGGGSRESAAQDGSRDPLETRPSRPEHRHTAPAG